MKFSHALSEICHFALNVYTLQGDSEKLNQTKTDSQLINITFWFKKEDNQ